MQVQAKPVTITLKDKDEARRRFPGLVGVLVSSHLLYDREYRMKVDGKSYLFRIS